MFLTLCFIIEKVALTALRDRFKVQLFSQSCLTIVTFSCTARMATGTNISHMSNN